MTLYIGKSKGCTHTPLELINEVSKLTMCKISLYIPVVVLYTSNEKSKLGMRKQFQSQWHKNPQILSNKKHNGGVKGEGNIGGGGRWPKQCIYM
jgi:hypothetical protein